MLVVKVAANVNRAINEVHEMCTDPLEAEILTRSAESIKPSDLRFFLQQEIKLILEHRIMSSGL